MAGVPLIHRSRENDFDLVVAVLPFDMTWIEEALERTLHHGRGAAIALADGTERLYSERLFCAGCGLGFEPLDPRLFSFNSRQGACPDCEGTGVTVDIDPSSVVDPSRSLDGGALLPLDRPELRAEK